MVVVAAADARRIGTKDCCMIPCNVKGFSDMAIFTSEEYRNFVESFKNRFGHEPDHEAIAAMYKDIIAKEKTKFITGYLGLDDFEKMEKVVKESSEYSSKKVEHVGEEPINRGRRKTTRRKAARKGASKKASAQNKPSNDGEV